jgi:hypothetical protein
MGGAPGGDPGCRHFYFNFQALEKHKEISEITMIFRAHFFLILCLAALLAAPVHAQERPPSPVVTAKVASGDMAPQSEFIGTVYFTEISGRRHGRAFLDPARQADSARPRPGPAGQGGV